MIIIIAITIIIAIIIIIFLVKIVLYKMQFALPSKFNTLLSTVAGDGEVNY